MGILKVNDMIPDFANFCTFKGSPRATAFSKVPATVGRGPVPRRASSVGKTALVGVRFSRRPNDRGGNPLACAYGRRGPPRYGCQGRLRLP